MAFLGRFLPQKALISRNFSYAIKMGQIDIYETRPTTARFLSSHCLFTKLPQVTMITFPISLQPPFWSCCTLVLIRVFIHYFLLTFLFLNRIQTFQSSSDPPSNICRYKTHNPEDFKKNVRVLNFLASLRIKFAGKMYKNSNKQGFGRNPI